MKLSTLLVIALFALCCTFASATSYTFGFGSVDGGLYCNYEQINNNSGLGAEVFQGVDNFSACGVGYNGTIDGAAGKVGGFTFDGEAVKISGALYADNIYDAFSGFYTGAQWFVGSNLKASSGKHPKIGWVGLASVSGVIFGDNAGLLESSIPGHSDASKGPNSGRAAAVRK